MAPPDHRPAADAHPVIATAPGPAHVGPTPPRRLHSTELFHGEQQIEIEHGDAVYRLRRTALGKLILTK